MTDTVPFTSSPIPIPEYFQKISYKENCYPGADLDNVEGGANCQTFAYAFIRHHGCMIPDFRSSDLWEDTIHTIRVDGLHPLDLVLVHGTAEAWGAHIGVYLGRNLILHLSKEIGLPVIEDLETLVKKQDYRYFIGAKRCLVRDKVTKPLSP